MSIWNGPDDTSIRFPEDAARLLPLGDRAPAGQEPVYTIHPPRVPWRRCIMSSDGQLTSEGGRRIALAGWLALPEPLIVEAAVRAGFDWIGFDLQHGAWDLGTAFRNTQLCDVLGKPVLIRLPDEQLSLIPRVLDHGASGIVLAMASEPAVVAAAVDRARYQPDGCRSYGGQRYGLRPEPSDLRNVRPAIFAMIETRRGVEAIDEIAAVEGIAGLHIGPVDLGLAVGVGGNFTAPAFLDAVARVVESGHGRAIPVTMHAVAPRDARRWVSAGFDELVLTADIELMRSAFLGLVNGARQAIAGREIAADPALGSTYAGSE
jgi:4-hydroxy-2-oxoheptanedioate aldolase